MSQADSDVTTLVPSVVFTAVFRADPGMPGVMECRRMLEPVIKKKGCMGCGDSDPLVRAYLFILSIIMSAAGAALDAWKKVFRASRLRVKLAGKGEILL